MHEGFTKVVLSDRGINKDFVSLTISRGNSTHIVMSLLAPLCNLQVSEVGLSKEGEHLLEVEPPSGTIHVGRFEMDVNERFW